MHAQINTKTHDLTMSLHWERAGFWWDHASKAALTLPRPLSIAFLFVTACAIQFTVTSLHRCDLKRFILFIYLFFFWRVLCCRSGCCLALVFVCNVPFLCLVQVRGRLGGCPTRNQQVEQEERAVRNSRRCTDRTRGCGEEQKQRQHP